MSQTRPALLAFAGPAVVAEDTINDLLVDYIGDGGKGEDGYQNFTREVVALLPVGAPLWGKGMAAVATWLDGADVPYTALRTETLPRGVSAKAAIDNAGEAATCQDVAAEILTRLVDARADFEVTLVLAWGEEGDAASEALLDAALDAGIEVRDLSAGLDDISFEDDSQPAEPEPALEPEPAKPTRRGRGGAPAQELSEEVADLAEPAPAPAPAPEPVPEPVEAEPAAQPSRTRQEIDAEEEVAKPFEVIHALVTSTHRTIVENLPPSRARSLAITALDEALLWVQGALGAPLSQGAQPEAPEPIAPSPAPQEAAQEAEEGQEEAEEEQEDVAPPLAPARTPHPPGTRTGGKHTAYILSPEGRYRLAGRGRPRTNHQRVMLEESEVVNARLEGLIDED